MLTGVRMTAESEKVGVLLVAHGGVASRVLEAARGIIGDDSLLDVECLDAGAGRTDALDRSVVAALLRLDRGRGVVVITDLFGASPCNCSRKNLLEHENGVLISGLNLAMLCKLAHLDRRALEAHEVADAIAKTGRRAISIHQHPEQVPEGAAKAAVKRAQDASPIS